MCTGNRSVCVLSDCVLLSQYVLTVCSVLCTGVCWLFGDGAAVDSDNIAQWRADYTVSSQCISAISSMC